MIENGGFQKLAESMIEDKQALSVIFREKPGQHTNMLKTIETIKKEWFSALWVDRGGHDEIVKFVPTDKYLKKMKRLADQSSSNGTKTSQAGPSAQ